MITHDYILSTFNYDKDTGIFTNKVRRSRRCNAGERSGHLRPDGYWAIAIHGKVFLAHRLAWFYVHGSIPDFEIDHINGNRSDNRISNLRLAPEKKNSFNRKRPKNNSTGFKGVSFSKSHKKYVARIQVKRKLHFIGYFEDPVSAHYAYMDAANIMHGEFATNGER